MLNYCWLRNNCAGLFRNSRSQGREHELATRHQRLDSVALGGEEEPPEHREPSVQPWRGQECHDQQGGGRCPADQWRSHKGILCCTINPWPLNSVLTEANKTPPRCCWMLKHQNWLLSPQLQPRRPSCRLRQTTSRTLQLPTRWRTLDVLYSSFQWICSNNYNATEISGGPKREGDSCGGGEKGQSRDDGSPTKVKTGFIWNSSLPQIPFICHFS